AAGVAGLVKGLLALEHDRLPKNLHFETPDPPIPWGELPGGVAAEAVAWPRHRAPRNPGVSSFRVTGRNASGGLAAAPPAARLALAVRTRDELRDALAIAAAGETPSGSARGDAQRGKLAWLFTGQGAQMLGMGRGLAAAWPVFDAALASACAALDAHLPRPLR